MNPIEKFTGSKRVQTAAGPVEVKEVPVRRLDELNALLSNSRGLTAPQLAIEQVKLFTGLPDDAIDALSHTEVIQVVEAGLEVNGGFFVSFAEAIRATSDRLVAKVSAASLSTTGSSRPSSAAS